MHTDIPANPISLKHAASHAVALVALGNPLRGDDAIALHLIAELPVELTANLCLLNAGSYTRDLPEFLDGHRTGIVLDALEGTSEMVVIDLSDTNQRQKVALDCCHALSWLDEIILHRTQFAIPEHLIFVGLPTESMDWHVGISARLQHKLPRLVKQLCQLIEQESADYA